MINNQSGNVLFYILIAVALLAALSYTVAQSNRGGVSGFSKDAAGIEALEIIEYGNILGSAVAQLRLRGYGDTEISFESNSIAGYSNPNCSEDGCKVFHVNGGGVNYIVPKEKWLDSSHSSDSLYQELYFHGDSSALDKGLNAKDDLVVFIPYLNKSVCIAINDKLGIDLSTDEVPSEVHGPFATNVKFIGNYSDADDWHVAGDSTPGGSDILSSHSAGCTEASGTASTPSTGTYHFYKVLLAR